LTANARAHAGKQIQAAGRPLPVLRESDVVVVGGSFAGVAAALAFAQVGLRVMLVEPRTYLGREVTAKLRPWIPTQDLALAGPLATCLRAAASGETAGEVSLQPDALKRGLEDLLLEAGGGLLYASLPLMVLAPDGVVAGLAIGNKSGRQVLACRAIVDATETAVVARVAGAHFEPLDGDARFHRTLEFVGVRSLRETRLAVPSELELAGDAVMAHSGCQGPEHAYVECALDLPARDDVRTAMQRESEARRRTMRLAAYLIAHVPAFHYALLASGACEVCGPHTGRLAGPPPPWTRELGSARVVVNGPASETLDAALAAFGGPIAGLWCLQEAARLPSDQAAWWGEPLPASWIGQALAGQVSATWDRLRPSSIAAVGTPFPAPDSAFPIEVREPDSPQRGRPYARVAVPPLPLPVLCEADVLVVGGGSSGASAAIAAAQEGMQTVLLDMNPGLGGTATLGGVDSYWFGRVVGFSARVSEWVEEVHDGLNYEGRRWSIEAKMHALAQAAGRAGVELMWNAIAWGAAVEGHDVRGVAAATRYGPCAILARALTDATGDGDVAAFAGAETVYGAARDGVTMWYSLAQFASPGRTQNNFTSMVDVSNVEDYTRAILAGRRRGTACHDHGVYVAPRETRHVIGDVVLTLTDQLLRRQWPDVVNVHFSNHDIKGLTGSNWLRLGLIPPNLEVEIPYRALLPRGLEQILVVGKAFSATHDALPAIRMQADLENLGGAAGLAAAHALRAGIPPRNVDVRALQQRLVREGLLPEDVLTREIVPHQRSDAELGALVASLRADRPLYAYSDMEMDEVWEGTIPLVEVCIAGPRAVPLLEGELASAEGPRRVLLAQALTLCGSQAGVPVLLGEVERLLAKGTVPPRTAEIRHTQLPPDQGAMPDVAYLLYALGMAHDRRALRAWERAADLLEVTEESLRDRFQGVFDVVHAICFGAERLGDPAAIPILERLHAHPPLRDQNVATGSWSCAHVQDLADFFRERQALLELAIGRALARCGDAQGIEVLIDYLDDSRAVLAEQAHAELVAVSGQDYGKDAAAWRAWLASKGGQVCPCPLPEPSV
jgi:ribulose 1,5-bisphosphate synthetase/thiazole synthase